MNDEGLQKIHPKSSFTTGEEAALYHLLGKVARDKGLLPSERCWRIAEAGRSTWAPELVLDRPTPNEPHIREILLTFYDGATEAFRDHWVIPGAWYKPVMGTLQEACSTIALREVGVDVVYMSSYPNPMLWPSRETDPAAAHPFGNPLSLFVKCVPRAPVQETPHRRFFRADRLPDPMPEVHRQFITETFASLVDIDDVELVK